MFSITKEFDTDLDKAETSQVSQITLELQEDCVRKDSIQNVSFNIQQISKQKCLM